MTSQATTLDQSVSTMFPGFDVRSFIEQAQDESMAHIPMPFVIQVPDFNPRRYRDPKSFAEFKKDVKKNKVLQPIIVRPNSDLTGFEVIAGHGRFEANYEAGHPTIPAIIRFVSDEQALAIALAENIQREDMSPIEEAEAARRMLGLCDGDKEEAIAHLNWDRQLFDRRIALLHCTESVKTALITRQIYLGHAELLAGLDEEMQDNSLKGIIARKVSVSDFQDVVGRYAYKISDAIFDCSQCAGCPHNSSLTSDLFDASLGEGRCMNRECYDQKTTEAIQAKADSLKEDYPAVWLDSEKAPEDRAFLAREGSTGVGRDQFAACKGCDHFGAIVSTAKGKEGEVTQNICFKISCHKQMVKSYQEQQKMAKAEPINMVGMAEGNSPAVTAPSTSTKAPKKKAKATEVPKRVLAYADKVHCQIATKAVVESTKMVKIFSLLALVKEYGHINTGEDSTSIIAPVLRKYSDQVTSLTAIGSNRAAMVAELSQIDDAILDELTAVFAAGIAGEKSTDNPHYNKEYMGTVQAALAATDTAIEDHWQINAEYLSNLTKSQIDISMAGSRFIEWYEKANGEGSYKKDFAGKRDELIKKIMESDYDWKGYIPTPIRFKV